MLLNLMTVDSSENDVERTLINKVRQQAYLTRSILEGGTGGTNVQEALANLGGISIVTIAAPNGIASLDATDLIPVELFPEISATIKPTIEGTKECYLGHVVSGYTYYYKITNFDSDTTYNISINKGEIIDFFDDTFTVKPEAQLGIKIITVNGKNFPISVIEPKFVAPVINSPVNGSVIAMTGIDLVFTNSSEGFASPVFTLHYQIATDPDFINLTHDTTGWPGNLSTVVEGAYYARMRVSVADAVLNINMTSDWSNVVQFYTYNLIRPTSLFQVINDHPAPYDAFIEANAALSLDGTLLATQKSNSDFSSSGIVIYKKASVSPYQYTQVAVIPQPIAYSQLSYINFSFSTDHQRFFVTRRIITPNVSESTSVWRLAVYKTTVNNDYSNWQLEQTLVLDLSSFETNPGSAIIHDDLIDFHVSHDEQRIAIGLPVLGITTGDLIDPIQNGCVLIFTKDQAGLYQQTHVIRDPHPDTSQYSPRNNYFGASVDLNHDASRLITNAPYIRTYDVNGNILDNEGALYVYELDGNNVYNLSYEYRPSVNTGNVVYLGYTFKAASHADVIVVGTYDLNDIANVLIFEKNNNVWSHTLVSPPSWDNYNNVFCGEAVSIAINSQGDFIAIGSPYSNTSFSYAYNATPWDGTGYVYLYNKTTSWQYTDLITRDVPAAISSKFGMRLSLSDNNELAIFAETYDRWTTYHLNQQVNDYNGAVLIYI